MNLELKDNTLMSSTDYHMAKLIFKVQGNRLYLFSDKECKVMREKADIQIEPKILGSQCSQPQVSAWPQLFTNLPCERQDHFSARFPQSFIQLHQFHNPESCMTPCTWFLMSFTIVDKKDVIYSPRFNFNSTTRKKITAHRWKQWMCSCHYFNSIQKSSLKNYGKYPRFGEYSSFWP